MRSTNIFFLIICTLTISSCSFQIAQKEDEQVQTISDYQKQIPSKTPSPQREVKKVTAEVEQKPQVEFVEAKAEYVPFKITERTDGREQCIGGFLDFEFHVRNTGNVDIKNPHLVFRVYWNGKENEKDLTTATGEAITELPGTESAKILVVDDTMIFSGSVRPGGSERDRWGPIEVEASIFSHTDELNEKLFKKFEFDNVPEIEVESVQIYYNPETPKPTTKVSVNVVNKGATWDGPALLKVNVPNLLYDPDDPMHQTDPTWSIKMKAEHPGPIPPGTTLFYEDRNLSIVGKPDLDRSFTNLRLICPGFKEGAVSDRNPSRHTRWTERK